MKVDVNSTRAESPQRSQTPPIGQLARSKPTTIPVSEFNRSAAVSEADIVSQRSRERAKSTMDVKKNDIEYARASRERKILLETKQQTSYGAVDNSDDRAVTLPSDKTKHYILRQSPSLTALNMNQVE